MRNRMLTVALLLTALTGVAYADARSDAKEQVEFGISVAQKGLWKEAIYRWERATQIDPTTPRRSTTWRWRMNMKACSKRPARPMSAR